MISRRTACLAASALLTALSAVAPVMSAPEQARTRSVAGVVTDRDGNALKGASVQLENLATLAIISFNTREDGRYSFHLLSSDVDFTLTAKYKRWFSKSKTLSRFDGHANAEIDLQIPID